MRKIRQDEVEAIASMAHMPEFLKFLGWLSDSRLEAVQGMTHGETGHLRSLSAGHHDVLHQIIDTSERANAIANDIRKRIQQPSHRGGHI